MIEAKFWAGLTDKQPEAYLERLRDGVLLFVAPASRVEALWSELCERARVRRPPSPERVDVKSVRTHDRKLLMLISWTHLLDRLESGDRHCRAEIQQLQGLAKWMDDQEEFPPLRLDELAPETPRRLRGLERLVKEATDLAPKFVEKGSQQYRLGWRLYFKGIGQDAVHAWFGIDLELWAQGKYPNTPIWLRFGGSWGGRTPRKALEDWGRGDPTRCFCKGDEIVVPIKLETGDEYDKVLHAVVERLRDVGRIVLNDPELTQE